VGKRSFFLCDFGKSLGLWISACVCVCVCGRQCGRKTDVTGDTDERREVRCAPGPLRAPLKRAVFLVPPLVPEHVREPFPVPVLFRSVPQFFADHRGKGTSPCSRSVPFPVYVVNRPRRLTAHFRARRGASQHEFAQTAQTDGHTHVDPAKDFSKFS
jgi:hypothetical protein